MSHPIWPVVTENLAEQLSATQSGIVHPAQLLPYLPLSLECIERTLDGMLSSNRVRKEYENRLQVYVFTESIDKKPQRFAPKQCIYSNEPLTDDTFNVIAPDVRATIESELALLATNDPWPAQANWQHELIYLAANLPAPVSTSAIAGHARLSFNRTEERLQTLQKQGAIHFDGMTNAWTLPPLRYPRAVYTRNDNYIRQFPGAIKEEFELRLVKGLSISLGILLAAMLLTVTARIPFPLVFFGALIIAFFIFIKILKAPAKTLPEL